MKRVLLIAYFFPPQANSGTQRPLKLANHLTAHGWTPTVLTVEDPPDARIEPALLDEVRPEVTVVRVPFDSLVTARRLAWIAGPFARRVRDGLEWRLRARHTFPDGYAAWRAGAVRAASRLHAQQPFDAVFATGYPWSSFDVARDIAVATGVPWVADFRDPWLDDVTFAEGAADARHAVEHGERTRRRTEAERAVLHDAAHVTAVTPRLAEYLRMRGGDGAAPISTIPNGWDRDDLSHAVDVPHPASGRRRVVYTGIWGAEYNPQRLYDAVAHLKRRQTQLCERLEIVTAGFAPGRARASAVDDVVHEAGRLPHREALGLMMSADALFLSVAGGLHATVQVPGKLYEYLATGRPVIAEAGPGAVMELMEATHGGLCAPPGDVAQLAALLERVAADGTATWPRASAEVCAPYERRVLAGQLAAVLHTATDAPRRRSPQRDGAA